MIAETKTYRRYKIEIHNDEFAESPREAWDNLGTMVLFHKRYRLGDTDHGYDYGDYSGWEELKKAILDDNPNAVILPVYMYDHSGLTISTTPFSCPWDSGQIGFIFISLYEARKEYGWKVITKKRRAQLEKYLQSEVEIYDAYIRGEVYGFKCLDPEGEDIDSCWGFYGDPEESGLIDEAKGQIDWAIKEKRKAHFEKLKDWIRNKVNISYREPLGAC